MRAFSRHVPVALLVALVAAAPAAGQSVQSIVEKMYDAHTRSAEGIDNYTLVQSVMGVESLSYFEKEVVDGHPQFRLRQTALTSGGMAVGGDDFGPGDIFEIGPDLIEHGRYAGQEQIDGTTAHVIAVDDLSQVDFGPPASPDEMDFVPLQGRLYVDAARDVPLRMEFDGRATTPQGEHDVTMQMNMLDYRDTEGLLLPFHILVTIDGFQEMIDPEMREQLAEFERQMESMPQEQRAMMEAMMGDRMESIRAMMAGGDGPMTIEIRVTEVRVNSGPPGTP